MCIYIYAYENNYKNKKFHELEGVWKEVQQKIFEEKETKGLCFNLEADEEELINQHSPR